MRIIHVGLGDVRLPPSTGGGTDSYIVKLAGHQAMAGHDVVVLDRRHFPSDPAEEIMGAVRLIRLKAPKLKPRVGWHYLGTMMDELGFTVSQALFAFSARSWIRNAAPASVINVHSAVIGAVLSFGNLHGAKLVYTSHTPRRLMPSRGAVVVASQILENWIVKRATKVIVLSAAVKKKLLKDVPIGEQLVEVVPVGIEFHEYQSSGDNSAHQKAGGKTVLFLGRVRPEKGVHYLLEAAGIMVGDRSPADVNFIIAGPVEDFHSSRAASSYLDRLRSTIEKLSLQEVVQITGRLSAVQVHEVLSRCDVFVLPSLTEAMPTSVLEAMCSGKPVVGSRVGGIPEQVEDGRSGFLVEPGDPHELSDRINFLLENPEVAETMGSYGRQLARMRFSWDVIAEKVLGVYSSIT